MEIPVINRISDFESGITSLQNPSFISQFFAVSRIQMISLCSYSFWKWGALILALLASLTTIIKRIKILIIGFKNLYSTVSSSLLSNQEDDYDYDYDSESDISCSSISDDDNEEDEEEDDEPEASSSRSWRYIDEDFSVKGSGHYIDDQWQNRNFRLRRRRNTSIGDFFSLSEFVNGKNNVVKLWDNLGLGLGLNISNNDNNGTRNVVSVYDTNREESIFSIFGGKSVIPAVSRSSSSSSPVIVSGSGNLLRVWDTRVGGACRIPQILAEWRPRLGKVVGVNVGDVQKVYVRDDVTGELTVGDMRKPGSRLMDVTESDVDTWWDADAVIVDSSTSDCEDLVFSDAVKY